MTTYGHLNHPETGEAIGFVKDGKLTMSNGTVYRIEGDEILAEDGENMGHLSSFIGTAPGTGSGADKLLQKK